jgi:hypothetical protein
MRLVNKYEPINWVVDYVPFAMNECEDPNCKGTLIFKGSPVYWVGLRKEEVVGYCCCGCKGKVTPITN